MFHIRERGTKISLSGKIIYNYMYLKYKDKYIAGTNEKSVYFQGFSDSRLNLTFLGILRGNLLKAVERWYLSCSFINPIQSNIKVEGNWLIL